MYGELSFKTCSVIKLSIGLYSNYYVRGEYGNCNFDDRHKGNYPPLKRKFSKSMMTQADPYGFLDFKLFDGGRWPLFRL